MRRVRARRSRRGLRSPGGAGNCCSGRTRWTIHRRRGPSRSRGSGSSRVALQRPYSWGGVPPPPPSVGIVAVAVGVAVGEAVGVAVGVAVGDDVAVAVGVEAGGFVDVGVALPGRGVGVTVAPSGRGVAVFPARPVAVGEGLAAAVAVVVAESLPPTSCAASTWLWVPSRSSRLAPLVPWSWERSCGRRDAESLCPGCCGVVTVPSAGAARQPEAVSKTTGKASMPARPRIRATFHLAMGRRLRLLFAGQYRADADPSERECVRELPKSARRLEHSGSERW